MFPKKHSEFKFKAVPLSILKKIISENYAEKILQGNRKTSFQNTWTDAKKHENAFLLLAISKVKK